MRTRLVIVFLVPVVGILMVLGGAYAWSSARSTQQEFYAQQLGDLGYFLTSARQALRSGSPTVIEGEAARYRQLYGTRVLVVDRQGAIWASGDREQTAVDETLTAQIQLALSGRRGELPPPVLPWSLGDAVIVEPVFDDGDPIGAVVIAASSAEARMAIVRQWTLLGGVAILAMAVGVFIVYRLAHWVLEPVRRVDHAMEEIEQGHMEARIADDTGPPELRTMIQVFNRMADEIERVVSRQQEFVLNASHELRNPLGALLMRVELLATGLGEEWEKDVETTREEGRRLTRILDALLSLARSGHGDGAAALVDLGRLARERVEAWQQVVARGPIRLVIVEAMRLPVVTDQTVVESALDAVIDNAVKFSPASSPVELRVREHEGWGEIEVRDHGPGVTAQELEHLTERFWRSAGSANLPGSGLGLAIASDLLASIEGELDIAADEGGGLRVRLRVPTGGVS